MQVFEIDRDYESEHRVKGLWSPDHTKESAHKLDAWNPGFNLVFDATGKVAPDDINRFRESWLVITVKDLVDFDAIGVFSQHQRSMPAINAAMKKAFEHVAPNAAQFIETDKVWAEYQDRQVPGGPFYVTNLLVSQDSWDSDAMEISKMTRKDGSSFELVEGAKRAVRSSSLTDNPIWRESRTGHVLCTDVMKEALQAAGCRGWYFRPVTVTDQ
ncbi:hypothetical protein GCM10007094_25720 [Pseudovibrio japonicus]|uniref:Immunity MXAN-0049 protein domain-containing protein n=1 Tax=Pseudovibrio japonicus TaxID=366534 RepID=A0ABQ3EI76_9HYPH|nr:DUF1629 domain-containing protein [Pseudovibrio japonicus]GHB35090.1 hypothetical protein GCM10007094_25720 [Pseudovibrio japonicus]